MRSTAALVVTCVSWAFVPLAWQVLFANLDISSGGDLACEDTVLYEQHDEWQVGKPLRQRRIFGEAGSEGGDDGRATRAGGRVRGAGPRGMIFTPLTGHTPIPVRERDVTDLALEALT